MHEIFLGIGFMLPTYLIGLDGTVCMTRCIALLAPSDSTDIVISRFAVGGGEFVP